MYPGFFVEIFINLKQTMHRSEKIAFYNIKAQVIITSRIAA